MKKTIITLFALSTMAGAADMALMLNSQTTTGSFEQSTTAGYIISVMDLDGFKALVSDRTSDTLFTFTLAGVDNRSYVGIATVTDGTMKGTHNAVGTSAMSAFYTPDGGNGMSSNIITENTVAIALTFAYDKTQGSTLMLSALDNGGNYTDTVASISGLHWNSGRLTGAKIDAAYVDYAEAYTGTFTTEELKTAAHGLLTLPTPEPATATLSLLALAGLASRRRRK